MKLPELLVPILKRVTDGKTEVLEFWNLPDLELRIELFFELSSELMMSDLDDQSVPEPFIWLAYIFYWESNCNFSGWYAIENKYDELGAILYSYKKVGLSSEANALEKAISAWVKSNKDTALTDKAYHSQPNPYADETVRYEYLANFFSANASKLFYVA